MVAPKAGFRPYAALLAALIALATLTATPYAQTASAQAAGSQASVSTVEITAYLHDRVAGAGGVGTIAFRYVTYHVSPSGNTVRAVSTASFEVGVKAKYVVKPSPYPGYVEWVINVSASDLSPGLVSNLIIYHRIKGVKGPVTVRLVSPSGRTVMEFTASTYRDVATGPSTYALNVSWHDFIPPLIVTHNPLPEASTLAETVKQALGTPRIPACMTLQVITRSEGLLAAPTLKWVEYCVPTEPLGEYGVALPEPLIIGSAELAVPTNISLSKNVLEGWETIQPYYAVAAYAAPTASGLGQPVNDYAAATPEYWLGPKPLISVVNWTATAVRTAAGYLRVERPATLYIYVVEGAEGAVSESLIIVSAVPYPEYVLLSTVLSNRTSIPAKILGRLKELEVRVAKLETEVTGLESVCRNLTASVEELLKNLKKLPAELTLMRSRLERLVEEVSNLKSRVEGVSGLAATLRANLTSLRALINDIEGRVSEEYVRLNAYVSGNASLLRARISELSAGLKSVKAEASEALAKAVKAGFTASQAMRQAGEALAKASEALTVASQAYTSVSKLTPVKTVTTCLSTAPAKAVRGLATTLWAGVAGVVLGCVAIGLALTALRRGRYPSPQG